MRALARVDGLLLVPVSPGMITNVTVFPYSMFLGSTPACCAVASQEIYMLIRQNVDF
jgi:hypothetical protein